MVVIGLLLCLTVKESFNHYGGWKVHGIPIVFTIGNYLFMKIGSIHKLNLSKSKAYHKYLFIM